MKVSTDNIPWRDVICQFHYSNKSWNPYFSNDYGFLLTQEWH